MNAVAPLTGISLLEKVAFVCRNGNPLDRDKIAQLGGRRVLVQVYGMRLLRVYNLGDEVRGDCSRLVSRVQHIKAHELGYLFNLNSFPSEVSSSPYLNHGQEFLATARGDMILDIQNLMRIRENPLADMRAVRLHMIPKGDEAVTMSDFFTQLQTKIQTATSCIFGWLGETTPATLQCQTYDWVEMQMCLHRYEAYPGYSFYDALQGWLQEQASTDATQRVKQTLYQRLVGMSPLYAALKKEQLTPLSHDPQISFVRESGCVLPKCDTFQAYVICQRQESLLRMVFSVIACCIHDESEKTRFKNPFMSHFQNEFSDSLCSSYILYFVDAVSTKYQTLQAQKGSIEEYHNTLHACIRLLGNLLCTDTKTLPVTHRRAFSLSLGLLFCMHIVSILPKENSRSFGLLDCAAILDYTLAHPGLWKRPVEVAFNGFVRDMRSALDSVSQKDSQSQFTLSQFEAKYQCFVAKFSDHEKKNCWFLWILEQFDLQPPQAGASFDHHIEFVKTVELFTRVRMSKEVVSFLLQSLCLNQKIFKKVEVCSGLGCEMKYYIQGQESDIPKQFVSEKFSGWLFDFLGEFAGLSVDAQEYFVELSAFFFNSFFPKDLSWRYSSILLLLCHELLEKKPLLQNAETKWQMLDSRHDFGKEYTWARHYNGYLLRFHQYHPATMCCSLQNTSSGPVFSILWMPAQSFPETRRIQIPLPRFENDEQVLDFYEIVGMLCDEAASTDDIFDQTLTLDASFLASAREFCKTLKLAMRNVIFSHGAPLISFDEKSRHFSISHVKAQTAPQAFHVRVDEYEALFANTHRQLSKAHIGRTGGIAVCICTLLTPDGVSEMGVDFSTEHTIITCEESGHHDGYRKMTREKYSVTLSLHEHPEVAYTVSYETPPTPLLLCWQLALLKELFYRLYLVS